MNGLIGNIEELTLKNNNFRQVVFTGTKCQVVLMSLLPSEEIGMEIHNTVDQFFRIEQGVGKVVMNGEESVFQDGSAFVVSAGTQHNVINTSSTMPLKLYTIYSPPNHPDGKIHATKTQALADEADHV